MADGFCWQESWKRPVVNSESPDKSITDPVASNGVHNVQPKSLQVADHNIAYDLKGRPVDKSKTGTWKAAGHFYGNYISCLTFNLFVKH
jgi:hypothetical protein